MLSLTTDATFQTLNSRTVIRATNGRSVEAKTVFAHSINYLKDEAIRVIRQSSGDDHFSPQDIQWVLTVPAIWTPGAKQFMREAAYEVIFGYCTLFVWTFEKCLINAPLYYWTVRILFRLLFGPFSGLLFPLPYENLFIIIQSIDPTSKVASFHIRISFFVPKGWCGFSKKGRSTNDCSGTRSSSNFLQGEKYEWLPGRIRKQIFRWGSFPNRHTLHCRRYWR